MTRRRRRRGRTAHDARRAFDTVWWGVREGWAIEGFGYGESCRVALDLGFELITGPFSSAQPSLPAPHHVWEDVREEILDPLRAARRAERLQLHALGRHLQCRHDRAGFDRNRNLDRGCTGGRGRHGQPDHRLHQNKM